MQQVEFNKSNENPFVNLPKCLILYQGVITEQSLNAAFKEVLDKEDKKYRELFYSILFSIGDITNRQHNIWYPEQKDSGGRANREKFELIFNWIKQNDYKQFLRFLHLGLFNEYTCFDLLFKCRVKTNRKGTVLSVTNVFADNQYCEDLANYCYKIINSNNRMNKLLLAKFLTIPRLSKRSHSKRMLPETLTIMKDKVKFLEILSNKMGWVYESNGKTYANFITYRNWRKEYNQNLESVLFSSKRILDFDQSQFTIWFNQLPAQARFRVKNRILYQVKEDGSRKYPQLYNWYKLWESEKESAQLQQRVLEEKVRQNQASEEDVLKLQKVKKEAKVTVGATNFKDLYKEICEGKVDQLKLESFINKVNLPYNMLTIIDDSGSMSGAPYNFATFMASILLVKNPDDTARNLLGFFSSDARLYTSIDKQSQSVPNNFYRNKFVSCAPKPFVDPKLSFYDNFMNIRSFCNAVFKSGGTHINAIPKYFAQIIDKDPSIKDELMNYPIWVILSDGDINNSYNARQSLLDFFSSCEDLLGYRPYVIIIDTLKYGRSNTNQWADIPNFMYIPSDPNLIEQVLCNFKDIDVMDIYAPLNSLYRSNRYSLIQENTL